MWSVCWIRFLGFSVSSVQSECFHHFPVTALFFSFCAGSSISCHSSQMSAQLPFTWREGESFLVLQPTDNHCFGRKYLHNSNNLGPFLQFKRGVLQSCGVILSATALQAPILCDSNSPSWWMESQSYPACFCQCGYHKEDIAHVSLQGIKRGAGIKLHKMEAYWMKGIS